MKGISDIDDGKGLDRGLSLPKRPRRMFRVWAETVLGPCGTNLFLVGPCSLYRPKKIGRPEHDLRDPGADEPRWF